jgi:DNA primase
MTILDLLSEDGIQTRKRASTDGGEYASACPFCGGKDRFCSWPGKGNGGKWWCRGCGRKGDLIQYLMDRRGLSFRDACRIAGLELSAGPQRSISCQAERNRQESQPRIVSLPPAKWCEKAEALVSWAEERLWGKDAEHVVQWLKDERGLSETTIRAFRLGWVPKGYQRERESWGLPVQMGDDGKPKQLWIPWGLLIPSVVVGQVVKLKVRRPDPDMERRYFFLPGSSPAPMVLGEHRRYVIVLESELDGMLCHQEAGDLVATIALGSAVIRPDKRSADLLKDSDTILVSLD